MSDSMAQLRAAGYLRRGWSIARAAAQVRLTVPEVEAIARRLARARTRDPAATSGSLGP